MAVTALTFAYASKFTNLPSGATDSIITEVYAEWSGTQEMWAGLSEPVRQAKRDQIINYLVAWKLTDLYPTCIVGVASNGGMPLKSKDIGGTKIDMLELEHQEGMHQLFTNMFGLRTYQMIVSAPERFSVVGRTAPYTALPYGMTPYGA